MTVIKFMNKTNTPIITWDEVSWADSYEVTIDDWVTVEEVLTNEFELEWFNFDRTTSTDDWDYILKVRAVRWGKKSEWSEWFDFSLNTILPTVSENLPISVYELDPISWTFTFNKNVKVTNVTWSTDFWISTRAEYTNTLVVNGTASNGTWNRTVNITVEDIAGNQLSFSKTVVVNWELPD